MTQSRPSPAVIERAAHWAAQLATEDATQADRDACEAWCLQHPSHRVAMERMRDLDARIDDADEIGREAIEQVLGRRSRKRSWSAGLVVAFMALSGASWLATHSFSSRGLFPDYETKVGEQRSVALADGSSLMLDTDAAIDVDQGADGRHITLFRGRVLARVATDAARPFVVETRDGTTTALGTAFIVHREDEATTVTVLASKVRACMAHERNTCADLAPGERARLSAAGLRRLDRVDTEAAALWSNGWLAVDDRPVDEVLRELNRYRASPVRYDSAELAHIRISGSFPLNDPDRALGGVARAAGLQLSASLSGGPVIHRAR